MGLLDGKVAIVTGAGKGLGKGEAMALGREGAKVGVLARTYEDVVQTAKELVDVGSEALALRCDVRNRADVAAAVAATVETFGTVDILVNNAQIIFDFHPLEEWTEEEMRATYESGLIGSWAFMLECFPYMKDHGGKIINLISAAGHGALPGQGGYGAAKEALRTLTRIAAKEWGKYKINVNAISPAAASDAFRKLHPTEEEQIALMREYGAAILQVGDAERDIGRAVVYLAGPDSTMITGCSLSVDCGMAML